MLGGSSPQIQAVFETGADLGLVEGGKLQRSEKSTGPNKKQFSLLRISSQKKICSFQDGSDAIETPNLLSQIFRVFEPKKMPGKFLFLHLEIRQH